MIHQPNAAGPALWMTAALVMNSTIDTKIATMSNVLRTRGSIPPAMRSEASSPDSSGPVVAILPSFHDTNFRQFDCPPGAHDRGSSQCRLIWLVTDYYF